MSGLLCVTKQICFYLASISVLYFIDQNLKQGKDIFNCEGAIILVAYICIYLHHQVNFSIESVRIWKFNCSVASVIDNHFQHKSFSIRHPPDYSMGQQPAVRKCRRIPLCAHCYWVSRYVTTQHCHECDATVTTRHAVSRISTANNTFTKQQLPAPVMMYFKFHPKYFLSRRS